MGLISDFRVGRLVERVLAAEDLHAEKTVEALTRLREAGKPAIPQIIEALSAANKDQRDALLQILITLLDNSTLSVFIKTLADKNPRIVNAITALLQQAGAYDPNRLIPHFENPDIPEAALIKILESHKQRVNPKTLLVQAVKLDRTRQVPLFNMIRELASEALIPDLVVRASAKEPHVRANVARVLGRFLDRPEVREALWKLLDDPQKQVRMSALAGVAQMGSPPDIKPVVKLLRDPDLNVQHRAIDALVQWKHPDTLTELLPLLQDDSEYIRRGAVEVLNAIADTQSIKQLLSAIKDSDWWVRERASDALIKIGGPRVVEAMLGLIKDDDEYIRRTAIEVINASGDERAFDQVLDALEDSDWWVRERAIDALATMGSDKSLPLLYKALAKDEYTRRAAVRALGQIGNRGAIKELLPLLKDPDEMVRKETLQALAALADEAHAHPIRKAIEAAMPDYDAELHELADEALRAVDQRAGGSQFSANAPETQTIRRSGTSTQPADSSNPPPPASPESASVVAGGEANLTQPEKLTPGTVLNNRYHMIRQIGKGAFGTVLLFEDKVLDERVIMKFINPQFATDENVRRRFIQEIRYARKVTHPNVIRIHDFLSFGDAAAISMEYFPGHTLADELKQDSVLDWNHARHILLQITAALAAAHREQVVHRDIKPANILINQDGLVKLVDFGIAAASGNAETRLTRTGMVVGTPTYLAPEQVLGKPVDNRTDIYSLGIIMYQMFAGKPPYTGEDAMSLMYQHVQGEAEPLYKVNPKISRTLSAIIMKAMARDPDKRYQSMDELHERLAMIPEE